MSYGRPVPERRTTEPSGPAQRWLARFSLLAIIATVALVIGSAGYTGLFLVVTGLITATALLAGMYWFLARRGIVRWIGLLVTIGAIVLLIYSYAKADVLVVALISLALMAIAVAAARAALLVGHQPWMPETPVSGANRPFIVMNPHSGGGKVVKFDLAAKARALGADVTLLDGPGYVDVAALVRDAVDRGADLLGVAGGDGTQALVAGIAAEHEPAVPGDQRRDPQPLRARSGVGPQRSGDLPGRAARRCRGPGGPGQIGDRPFVNNASFGAYAADRAEPGIPG